MRQEFCIAKVRASLWAACQALLMSLVVVAQAQVQAHEQAQLQAPVQAPVQAQSASAPATHLSASDASAAHVLVEGASAGDNGKLPATLLVGQVELQRCHGQRVYCGRIDRPFDPTGVVPGTISIYFQYYLHTASDQPSAGTLVAVEGGPGYPSTGTRFEYLKLYQPLLAERDLLLVDNRGTGHSKVIDCPDIQTRPLTVAGIAQCGRQLADTAPLYSSAYAADDMAAVLQALGKSGIDLYGDSYGTYFSQVFAYRHPDLLRSIVLDSAYPVPMVGGETPFYPYFAPTMRAEFNLVCARSPGCAALPGDSIAHIQPALDLLRAAPFRASAMDASGHVQHFLADASLLGLAMFGGAPAYTNVRELDAAARAFVQGDQAPLLRTLAETLESYPSTDASKTPSYYSWGLFWAVSCQDYAQIYDMTLPPAQRKLQRDLVIAEKQRTMPDLYAPFTIDEFRGIPLDLSILDGCVAWPSPSSGHPPGPLLPKRPVMPDVPVLVLSGEIDTITTPPEGAAVASLFPHARQVVVKNNFHLTALPPELDQCGIDIVRHFIETLDAGDVRCAAEVPNIRTPPSFARTVSEVPAATPLAGNQASPAQLQTAAAVVQTLGDAVARLDSHASGHSVGLRGGDFEISTPRDKLFNLKLNQVRWTEDLAVSGTLDWPYGPGQAHGKVQFLQQDGTQGFIEVTWTEQLNGSMALLKGQVDGKTLQAQTPAP